ncbi:MAG: M18 family aminopeptidase [Clostridia bacterium]|nr:M18 family aminopeptidase [Clostridia bacterium]
MKNIRELLDFINASKTSHHAAHEVAVRLDAAGFTALKETEAWQLSDGEGYYLLRGGAIIAFKYKKDPTSMAIISAHSDSPAFKVKCIPESVGSYTRLSVESYGGAINYTWFDRPLSVAGRALVSCSGGAEMRLVDISEPIAVIPSVAPHLKRDINSSFAPNLATDLQPLFSISQNSSLMDLVAERLGVEKEDVLSHDLYLYCAEKASLVGKDNELVLAPRIDDLASVFGALDGLLNCKDSSAMPVLAVFDNEEVGSSTLEGAASDLFADVLEKTLSDSYQRVVRASLMLSCDGAHALHPNHPELSDPACRPVLGGGVVIKYNANRRYSTDATSDGALRALAKRAGIALQCYANRADLPGGSTLGSIATTRVPVTTADIGVAQLAMHSAVETCAASDIYSLCDLAREFYSAGLVIENGGFKL